MSPPATETCALLSLLTLLDSLQFSVWKSYPTSHWFQSPWAVCLGRALWEAGKKYNGGQAGVGLFLPFTASLRQGNLMF